MLVDFKKSLIHQHQTYKAALQTYNTMLLYLQNLQNYNTVKNTKLYYKIKILTKLYKLN